MRAERCQVIQGADSFDELLAQIAGGLLAFSVRAIGEEAEAHREQIFAFRWLQVTIVERKRPCGVLVGGLDGLTLDPKEVLEARLFSPADLPDGLPEAHRELAGSL